MGCTGGCINGGGQPIVSAAIQEKVDVRARRAKVLYNIDENATFRKSHENPAVKQIYAEFLGEPNSHLSHELLHTHYHLRDKYSAK
ncbi:MAG: iron hydrogenase small subunit [Bacillus subtilis]|nr:iron hydrogenase small subunit [Bacillus subtilis]